MKKNMLSFLLLVFSCLLNVHAQDLTRYVDPFIGTGGHGHTYPGSSMPFGMIQLSPDTRTGNWDACSGYHYSDSTIIGFSHTHLSGTGCLDYGDILFMPTSGKIQMDAGDEKNTLSGYRSKFSHNNETAEPGYYSVLLGDDNIKVELTATERAGFHRYTYQQTGETNLIIDLNHQVEPTEIIKELELKITGNNRIEGYRRTQGWAADQVIYFVAEFSEPFIEYGIQKEKKIFTDIKEAKSTDLKAFFKFKSGKDKTILIKVAISAVDYEGAAKNLAAEIPGWDFDKVRKNAKEEWNKKLNQIIVKDKSEEKKKIFYTALYHSFLSPNMFFDTDRRYRGNDGKIHTCTDFDNYTVFSLWDTFRATHPLFVLLEPKRASDMIKSMLAKYNESGMLPKWDLAGNETGTMIGYHAIPVITDAYIKGIKDFDVSLALEAMKNSAYNSDPEMKLYTEFGYIHADRKIESVSKTLEYAYDDWAIYTLAAELGKKEVTEEFKTRSKFYINLFDGSTGFFRAKNANGSWINKFDPFEISRDYTEGNAWQYSMFAPHDVNGLINLYGGKKNLENHLDKLFSAESHLTGKNISDVTGLVGQYAHGNEPSHHIAYIYNFTDSPWKTQEKIHQVLNEMYTTKPDGLIGNEDCGQMSAWFNFSSFGFYPFCPGTDEYQIGTPFFEEAIIKTGNGKEFIIKTENLSEKNFYIQSVKLNGKDYNANYIKHEDIINGGEIVFTMGSKTALNRGTNSNLKAYSLSEGTQASIPYIKNNISYFMNETEVELGCTTEQAKIYYTLDGSEPSESSALYAKPFNISKTLTLKARAYKDGILASPVLTTKAVRAEFKEPANITESQLTGGINYKYFEGKYSSAYDVLKASAKKSGSINYFGVEEAELEDHYGFIFTGYIYIPEDNIYTFYTKSDDGSIFLINDEEVVNNDGSHAAISASNVVALKKGYHPYTLLYFEDYEGNSVELGWESSSIQQQPVPASNLFKLKN